MMAYPWNPYNYYQQAVPPPAQNQSNGGPIWIQGEAAAKSYLVAPGATVALWDIESQTIYLKSADASGMPSMKIFDYTVRDTAPANNPMTGTTEYATKADLEELKKQIAELKGEK